MLKKLTLIIIILTFTIKVFAFNIIRICEKENDITIIWNVVNDTCQKFNKYEIYGRESATDNFKKIDENKSYFNNEYVHIGAGTVSNNWEYFIVAIIQCGNQKMIYSDTLNIDKNPPKKINIDSVSVKNGRVIIGWEKSKDKDTKGYIVYYVNGAMNIIIDTLIGNTNTYFTDKAIRDPRNQTFVYKVVAMDSCENLSIFSDKHNNIKLNISQNFCSKTVSLNWNRYIAWDIDSINYEILVKIEGKNKFKILYTVAGSVQDIVINNLENDTNYVFKIRARNLNNNFTSSSNELEIKTNFINTPESIYLRNVSVKSDNEIEIKWEIRQKGDIKKFNIYRGIKKVNLNKIIEESYNNSLSYSYIDNGINTNLGNYLYQIKMVDNCDNEYVKSNISQTIFLIKNKSNDGNELIWTKYFSWDGDVNNYVIYDEDDLIFGQCSNNDTTKQSGFTEKEMRGKEKCFYIKAKEKVNSFGYSEESKSNKVCITGSHIVFFPTVLNLSSEIVENKYFKPIGVLINYEETEIVIYNRLGEIVWNKIGIDKGWKGEIRETGDIVPIGTYIYIVNLVAKNNEIKRYSGILTVLR